MYIIYDLFSNYARLFCIVMNGMNYLNKESYTESSVFNYNDKFTVRFVASWNFWVIQVEFPSGGVK